jgi:hypothetical protein
MVVADACGMTPPGTLWQYYCPASTTGVCLVEHQPTDY